MIWLQEFGSNSPASELNRGLLPEGSGHQVRCSVQLHPGSLRGAGALALLLVGSLAWGWGEQAPLHPRDGVCFPGGSATDRAEYGGEHLVMLCRDTHSSMGLIFTSSLDALLLPGSSHRSPSPPSLHPSLSFPDPSSHSLAKQQLQANVLPVLPLLGGGVGQGGTRWDSTPHLPSEHMGAGLRGQGEAACSTRGCRFAPRDETQP